MFTVESLYDLLVWAGVIIVYVLNIIFKKSSEETGRSKEQKPYENSEPLDNPFDEIRKEILRKKREREVQEEARAEVLVEREAGTETEVERNARALGEPSPFQVHLEEHALQIKEKQEEAKRLKAKLEQINDDPPRKRSFQGDGSTFVQAAKVSKKVRAVLRNKGEIKATLIAWEILAQPLALRTGRSVGSPRT